MEISANKSICGFTLVEVLAVIVIIALLMSATMIGLTKARVTASRTKTRDLCRQISDAWKMYLIDNQRFPDDSLLGKKGGDYIMDIKTLNTLNGCDYNKDTNSVVSSAYIEVSIEELGLGTNKRSKDSQGLLDKWGNYICFNLDFDLAGEVDHPAPEMYGNKQEDYKTIKAHQIVWSKGDKPDNKKRWIVIW